MNKCCQILVLFSILSLICVSYAVPINLNLPDKNLDNSVDEDSYKSYMELKDGARLRHSLQDSTDTILIPYLQNLRMLKELESLKDEKHPKRHSNHEFKIRRFNRAAPPSVRKNQNYGKRRPATGDFALCHFKICNIKLLNGRKRSARFAKPNIEYYDYNFQN